MISMHEYGQRQWPFVGQRHTSYRSLTTKQCWKSKIGIRFTAGHCQILPNTRNYLLTVTGKLVCATQYFVDTTLSTNLKTVWPWSYVIYTIRPGDLSFGLKIRAFKWLLSLIALIVRLIFNHVLIAVLTHTLLFFFNLFVFHLHVDVVGPLLLNASLLLVLMTDYSDWLVQVTELIDSWQSRSLVRFQWFFVCYSYTFILQPYSKWHCLFHLL